LDCIFKIHGIVPKKHICRSCEPLKAIFKSVGINRKMANLFSKKILRAFKLIKLEDTFRDELLHKKIIAKIISVPLFFSLPKKIKNQLKTVNKKINLLENSKISASRYVKEVSKLGGSIFKSVTGLSYHEKDLEKIGSILTAALIVNDMNKDLKNDIKERKFNPFKKCGKQIARKITQLYRSKFNNFTKSLFPKGTITLSKGFGFGILGGLKEYNLLDECSCCIGGGGQGEGCC
jgi:hypothetical protein